MHIKLFVAILCYIGYVSLAIADEGTPCFIFSGASGQEYVLSLNEYNRIVFGERSMTVSRSGNPDKAIELLYTAFNRIAIGEAKMSGSEEMEMSESSISYDSGTQSLSIESKDAHTFEVGVFSIMGHLMCHAQVFSGSIVSLESLQGGVYIAVATDGYSVIKVKFLK